MFHVRKQNSARTSVNTVFSPHAPDQTSHKVDVPVSNLPNSQTLTGVGKGKVFQTSWMSEVWRKMAMVILALRKKGFDGFAAITTSPEFGFVLQLLSGRLLVPESIGGIIDLFLHSSVLKCMISSKIAVKGDFSAREWSFMINMVVFSQCLLFLYLTFIRYDMYPKILILKGLSGVWLCAWLWRTKPPNYWGDLMEERLFLIMPKWPKLWGERKEHFLILTGMQSIKCNQSVGHLGSG